MLSALLHYWSEVRKGSDDSFEAPNPEKFAICKGDRGDGAGCNRISVTARGPLPESVTAASEEALGLRTRLPIRPSRLHLFCGRQLPQNAGSGHDLSLSTIISKLRQRLFLEQSHHKTWRDDTSREMECGVWNNAICMCLQLNSYGLQRCLHAVVSLHGRLWCANHLDGFRFFFLTPGWLALQSGCRLHRRGNARLVPTEYD